MWLLAGWILLAGSVSAQELQVKININSSQVEGTDKTVFEVPTGAVHRAVVVEFIGPNQFPFAVLRATIYGSYRTY